FKRALAWAWQSARVWWNYMAAIYGWKASRAAAVNSHLRCRSRHSTQIDFNRCLVTSRRGSPHLGPAGAERKMRHEFLSSSSHAGIGRYAVGRAAARLLQDHVRSHRPPAPGRSTFGLVE